MPAHRIIGSGTNLDSARFRYFISEKLDISSTSVHGWIIGEHGDSSVALWSGLSVGGVNLNTLNPKIGQMDDPENWKEIHHHVVQSAYEIINLKGYTSWAIGLSVANICRCILRNEKRILALSTSINDWNTTKDCGITENDIFFSVPCILGRYLLFLLLLLLLLLLIIDF